MLGQGRGKRLRTESVEVSENEKCYYNDSEFGPHIRWLIWFLLT